MSSVVVQGVPGDLTLVKPGNMTIADADKPASGAKPPAVLAVEAAAKSETRTAAGAEPAGAGAGAAAAVAAAESTGSSNAEVAKVVEKGIQVNPLHNTTVIVKGRIESVSTKDIPLNVHRLSRIPKQYPEAGQRSLIITEASFQKFIDEFNHEMDLIAKDIYTEKVDENFKLNNKLATAQKFIEKQNDKFEFFLKEITAEQQKAAKAQQEATKAQKTIDELRSKLQKLQPIQKKAKKAEKAKSKPVPASAPSAAGASAGADVDVNTGVDAKTAADGGAAKDRKIQEQALNIKDLKKQIEQQKEQWEDLEKQLQKLTLSNEEFEKQHNALNGRINDLESDLRKARDSIFETARDRAQAIQAKEHAIKDLTKEINVANDLRLKLETLTTKHKSLTNSLSHRTHEVENKRNADVQRHTEILQNKEEALRNLDKVRDQLKEALAGRDADKKKIADQEAALVQLNKQLASLKEAQTRQEKEKAEVLKIEGLVQTLRQEVQAAKDEHELTRKNLAALEKTKAEILAERENLEREKIAWLLERSTLRVELTRQSNEAKEALERPKEQGAGTDKKVVHDKVEQRTAGQGVPTSNADTDKEIQRLTRLVTERDRSLLEHRAYAEKLKDITRRQNEQIELQNQKLRQDAAHYQLQSSQREQYIQQLLNENGFLKNTVSEKDERLRILMEKISNLQQELENQRATSQQVIDLMNAQQQPPQAPMRTPIMLSRAGVAAARPTGHSTGSSSSYRPIPSQPGPYSQPDPSQSAMAEPAAPPAL